MPFGVLGRQEALGSQGHLCVLCVDAGCETCHHHVRPCAGGRSRDDVVTREIPATYPSPAGSSLMVRVVSRTTAFLIAFSTFREIKPTAGQGRNLCDVLRVIELSFQEIPAFSISLPWLDSENVLSSILGKRYLSLQLEE